MALKPNGLPYTYAVSRLERDDGTWNAQPEFLWLDKTGGFSKWEKHKAHANKFTLGEAFAISQALEGKPKEDGDPDYYYSYEAT